MAYEKQYWKDTLQTAESKRSRSDDSVNKEQQKKQSRLMYNRRKLERDVKRYIKGEVIRGSEIERIGRQHGFYIEWALLRKNKIPYENVKLLFKRRKMSGWELSLGLYPGVLLGVRSYINKDATDHVLYIPFVELCLTVYYE